MYNICVFRHNKSMLFAYFYILYVCRISAATYKMNVVLEFQEIWISCNVASTGNSDGKFYCHVRFVSYWYCCVFFFLFLIYIIFCIVFRNAVNYLWDLTMWKCWIFLHFSFFSTNSCIKVLLSENFVFCVSINFLNSFYLY